MSNMFEQFLVDLRNYLPLRISIADWNDPLLTILGDNWNFNAMTEWRICNEMKILKACYDDESEIFIRKIIGLSIINVNCQSGPPVIDPVFVLSNGMLIQIFSTNGIDPWSFKLPNNKTYIASPTDDNWGLNYIL